MFPSSSCLTLTSPPLLIQSDSFRPHFLSFFVYFFSMQQCTIFIASSILLSFVLWTQLVVSPPPSIFSLSSPASLHYPSSTPVFPSLSLCIYEHFFHVFYIFLTFLRPLSYSLFSAAIVSFCLSLLLTLLLIFTSLHHYPWG